MKNSADQQKLCTYRALRNATVGWNMHRWKIYYGFLQAPCTKSGGNSYWKLMINIELEAFANANYSDRFTIEASKLRPAFKPKALPVLLGPGKERTTAGVVALEGKLKSGRNL